MATKTGSAGALYRVRIGVGLAAAGALLAACGSSSKGASTSGTVTTGPSTAAASTTPSTTPSSSTSSSSGSGKVNTDLGGGSFCDKAKKASANFNDATDNITTDTPEQLKNFEQSALDELKALQSQAPSEIQAPIGTVVDAEQKLFADLQAANFDFTKISSEITTQFDTPEFTAAESKVTAYLAAKCGIDPSAEAS